MHDTTQELAVMVIKTKDSVLSYPTVETVQEDSICKLVYAPARNVSDDINQKAQELARKAVATFEGKGAFGVEMFLLNDNSLLLCELASRVHNSGHYTIEGCGLSQFDTHLRAILDLPIPPESVQIRQPSIMLNIIGGAAPDTHLKAAEAALSIPNAAIHLYSKGAAKPGRKMGHITVTAPTMHEAEKYIQPLIDVVDDIRAQRSDIKTKPAPSGPTKPAPQVAVMMGSDSDLKTLVPGLKLLRDYFGIEPAVDITSAHRTPTFMAEYSASAAARGIKVIIAAAGGAAHLPGMAAAHTALPVIGVPVKGSSLDGVDSLHSIVQMPRGMPSPHTSTTHMLTCQIRRPGRHSRHQQQHQRCPPGRSNHWCVRPRHPAQGRGVCGERPRREHGGQEHEDARARVGEVLQPDVREWLSTIRKVDYR
jgi:phosphoribosylaminoimidazole carboxylase